MIHTWLHPWLPLLGPQIEGLFPSIRHKLSLALQSWHPSDGSAISTLEPWARLGNLSTINLKRDP